MKLIIDVDEKLVCEGFKRNFTEEERNILIRAIGNGTPVSIKGDLISRSALKEAIETWDKFACLPDCKLEPVRNLEHPEMFVPYIHFDDVIKAIDNAQTVETDIEVVAKDAYEQGYTDGWKERFGEPNERPQGEWIFTCIGYYKCSNCGEVERAEKNYCPNCGAQMRGKEE